jgi:hypothetical protein
MKKGQRKQQYNQYMKSDEWREFRKRIIRERGHACERCGQTRGEMHLHHLTYVRFMRELPQDVQLVCLACHKKEHPSLKGAGERRKAAAKRFFLKWFAWSLQIEDSQI